MTILRRRPPGLAAVALAPLACLAWAATWAALFVAAAASSIWRARHM